MFIVCANVSASPSPWEGLGEGVVGESGRAAQIPLPLGGVRGGRSSESSFFLFEAVPLPRKLAAKPQEQKEKALAYSRPPPTPPKGRGDEN
jgi:hypothetical protein